MIGDNGWPVFDPGSSGIADLFPYIVELWVEVDITDILQDALGPDDPTKVQSAAQLVERCMASAELGRR